MSVSACVCILCGEFVWYEIFLCLWCGVCVVVMGIGMCIVCMFCGMCVANVYNVWDVLCVCCMMGMGVCVCVCVL